MTLLINFDIISFSLTSVIFDHITLISFIYALHDFMLDQTLYFKALIKFGTQSHTTC